MRWFYVSIPNHELRQITRFSVSVYYDRITGIYNTNARHGYRFLRGRTMKYLKDWTMVNGGRIEEIH